jgi:nucleotidyltransferase/DNA polymerase involved in DNA repair
MYALVDCNNFYVSCERAFQPALHDAPVVVLSNNDGCVISRSAEAKALGIRMGAPLFQIRPLIAQHQVKVFSSNYALYGDMSHRVMHYLASVAPELEVYSIDEAFLSLHGLEGYFLKRPSSLATLETYARGFQAEIKKRTHIPTCVGIAPTKTLAKLANHLAKKDPTHGGVLYLDSPARCQWALGQVAVADVWGIGRRNAPKLQALGLYTAADLAAASDAWARRYLGGVVGVRLVRELQGYSCHQVSASEDGRAARQSIAHTRSFGRPLTELADLRGAITATCSPCSSAKISSGLPPLPTPTRPSSRCLSPLTIRWSSLATRSICCTGFGKLGCATPKPVWYSMASSAPVSRSLAFSSPSPPLRAPKMRPSCSASTSSTRALGLAPLSLPLPLLPKASPRPGRACASSGLPLAPLLGTSCGK